MKLKAVNPIVELKLMRTLITQDGSDLRAIEQLDKFFYLNIKTSLDKDVDSLIGAINYIKIPNSKITLDFVKELYSFFSEPKYDEPRWDFVSDLISHIRSDNWDWKKQIIFILAKKPFGKLSFTMGMLLINIEYYRQNSTFMVVNSRSKSRIMEAIRKGCILEYTKELSRVENYNKLYHIKNNVKCNTFAGIRKILHSIPEEILKRYNILEIYMYGSHVCNRQNEFSDIDLKVVIEETMQNLDDIADCILSDLVYFLGDKVDIKVVSFNMKMPRVYYDVFCNEILVWKRLK